MATVPPTKFGKLQFYEAHIDPWTNNAAAIGLGLPDIADLTTATNEARAAYNGLLIARDAAKAATLNFTDKVATMHGAPGLGSDMIDTIRNFAQSTDDDNVYVLAQIPAPGTPGAVGPPGIPFDFRVGLLQDGSTELTWKCNNPVGARGTVYEIFRADSGNPMAFLNTAGSKSYTDSTLPSNSSPVTYRVTGIRSTLRGNPGQFTVQFGAGGAVQVNNDNADGGDLNIAA